MKYKEKIKYAETVAQDLLNEKPLTQIKSELKEKGLYEADISNVLVSARNIIGEQFQPLIREKLLEGEDLKNVAALEKVDPDTLERLVKREARAIANDEKRKVNEWLKNGASPQEILNQVRLEFYPAEKVAHQIAVFKEVEKQNSGSGRMVNIGGGLALILIGSGLSIASMQGGGGGLLFYGAIGVGLIMLIKGFTTVQNPMV